MQSQKNHDELIEKYYPNGCILTGNMPVPEFSNIDDPEELKQARQKKFFDELDAATRSALGQ